MSLLLPNLILFSPFELLMNMVFFLHFLGELELPEELPEFPYESEFIQEIENAILKYGGQEGCTLLKEHAIEQRENLESSLNQNLSGKMKIP